jgi:hypothetical protein
VLAYHRSVIKMDSYATPGQKLAAALVDTDDPVSILPANLPCSPLELLIALHAETLRTMLSDLARTGRGAAVVRLVASRFPNDLLVQAQAHWTQGSAICYIPDYSGALHHYDEALAWYKRACQQTAPDLPPRDIPVVEAMRVFCLSELGRYHEAHQAVAAAERWFQGHPNPRMQLSLLVNQTQLAGTIGDYPRMVDLADATIDLATQLDNPSLVAMGWINRAYACIYLGRFAEADEALRRGIAAATTAGESITVARAQWNQARLLRCQGQLFAALKALHEAQAGLAQASGEAATVALEKASLYEQLRQLPQAHQAARWAAAQFQYQEMPVYSAIAALSAARIAVQQRRARSAQQDIALAIAQMEHLSLPSLRAEIALVGATIVTLLGPSLSSSRRRRQLRAARASARQAVETLQATGLVRETAVGRMVVATLDAQMDDTKTALQTYRELAQHSDHQIRLAAIAELGALLPHAEALPYLCHAAALAVEQRRALPMEELQAHYSSETSPYHMRLAACYLASDDVAQAFESILAAKAGPLLDLRVAAGTLDTATRAWLETAKMDLARWRTLHQEHLRKAQAAEAEGHHESAAYHAREAKAAQEAVDRTEQMLTETMRTFGDRIGQGVVPSLAAIQATLPAGTALLEYTRIDDDLLCFLIQSQRPPVWRRLGSYRTIKGLCERWKLVFHHIIHDRPMNARQQLQSVLAPLWGALLAPWRDILGAITHLVIAPCALLYHLPWAALFDGATYLSDRVTVTLTPSGGVWAAPLDSPSIRPGRPHLLGYAGQGERHLSHVAAELAAIARHLPDAQVTLPAAANDLRVTPPPRLLHITTHGLTASSAPLCSTLELADGPFLLLEAHRLDLRGTDLVTLSACETGVAPDYGDMTMALAGAFLCAGSRGVLASLWSVSDAATVPLMEQFYAALAAGAPAATALRLAQSQVRADHPLNWAAFQLWAGAQ